MGDHICCISNLTKIHTFFPNWRLTYGLPRIISEMIDHRLRQKTRVAPSFSQTQQSSVLIQTSSSKI